MPGTFSISAVITQPPPVQTGGLGCLPKCIPYCPTPRNIDAVSGLGDFVGGGDPVMIARLALSLCMLAVRGH